MKTSIYSFLLVLLFSLPSIGQTKEQPPKGGEPRDFHLPQKEVINFDNGLKLVLVPYGSIPKVLISISVKTGNINENKDEVWLADLLAKLMEEGPAENYSVKDKLAGMGGSLSINVGPLSTSLNTDVLSEFAPEALGVLADVLINPKLPESELERLKNNMKRNLTVSLARPGTQARKEFYAEIYPDHPYGRLYPTEKQVDTYSIADVKSFYQTNFGAQRTTVYVVGNFNAEQIKEMAKEKLNNWKKGQEISYPIAHPQSTGTVKVIDRPGAPQSTIMFGLPINVDPSNKDYIPLNVMNSLLGGSFGSRITSNIRENKGYTYSPRSSYITQYKTGLWVENADVTTEFTGPSIDEIKKEIVRLQNEAPTKSELQGIQNYESGFFVLMNSIPEGIIEQLDFLEIHRLPESFLENQVKNINGVIPQQIQEVAKKYLPVEKMTLVVVGDKDKIKDQVKESLARPKKKEQ